MSTLSFVHYTTAGQIKAGEKLIENVRSLYPDAFYMVICDKGDDYLPLCNKYGLEYYHSQRKIGYPDEPYGYPMYSVLEFWERFCEVQCISKNGMARLYGNVFLLVSRQTVISE